MARFYGRVGFAGDSVESESGSGIFEDVMTEVSYYGEIIRDTRNIVPGENVTPNISVSNQISIIADSYAYDNILAIRYVEWVGVLWTVTHVDIQRPRLLLSLGERYNGPTPS